jgi:hypothetical protein
MEPATLATARNLALILLVVEAAVLTLPLLIIPFFILRHLPRIKTPIRPALRTVRQRTEQVERGTKAVMSMAVQPLLWTMAAIAGLRGALSYVARRR